MPNYRRSRSPGGVYFFSVVSYQRRKILCNQEIRLALRQAIIGTQQAKPFKIDAWVLLPDHLHCIWTLPEGDNDYSSRWAMIKSSVSKGSQHQLSNVPASGSRLKRNESDIWQRRFWEHQINSDEDYRSHVDYLHWNPVKHGLVGDVSEWPFSTFHRYQRAGLYPAGWGGSQASSNETDFGE